MQQGEVMESMIRHFHKINQLLGRGPSHDHFKHLPRNFQVCLPAHGHGYAGLQRGRGEGVAPKDQLTQQLPPQRHRLQRAQPLGHPALRHDGVNGGRLVPKHAQRGQGVHGVGVGIQGERKRVVSI